MTVFPTEDAWAIDPYVSNCDAGLSCYNTGYQNFRTGAIEYNVAEIGIITEIAQVNWWPINSVGPWFVGGWVGLGQAAMTYSMTTH